MMKEKLPQELQDLIIAHIAGHWWRPGFYLKTCALVSKRWLREARRHYFSKRTLVVYTGGDHVGWHRYAASDRFNKTLRDFLYQNEPICTFWPSIIDMHVDSYYPGTPEDFISLLSLCLSRASNLRTLRVSDMEYSDSLKDAILNLGATQTITAIYIERCTFPSPEELDVFLGLFPQLHVKCRLEDIEFECTEWDGKFSYTFSPDPSLQFSIRAFVREDFHLEVFLHHQWNITDLQLEPTDSYEKRMDFHLVTNALKQIGASLKSLSLELHYHRFRGPLPLSLSHNTSLQSLVIKGLADFNGYDPILDLPWLIPVLNTIESREEFRELKGILAWDRNYNGPEALLCQWLTSFDWAAVEGVVLDLRRFPGEPKFTLSLSAELKFHSLAWGALVALRGCMPRLFKAGRLLGDIKEKA